MTSKQRTASSTHRLRWLIPALGILAWIVLGSFTGPFAGKLASVSTNDNTAVSYTHLTLPTIYSV